MMKMTIYAFTILLITACGTDNNKIDIKPTNKTAPMTEQMKAKKEHHHKSFISGEVMYRERIALPPGSILIITLEDVSKMDVASTIIGKKTMILNSAPPYSFTLDYPTDQIQDKFNYSIRARIENNGKLLFTTTEYIDPFHSDNEKLKIMMNKIQPAQAKAIKDSASAGLKNTKWVIEKLGDKVITINNEKYQPYFQISNKDKIVSGFSGCNQFSGKYTNKNNEIRFSPLATTKKACIQSMDIEKSFLSALENCHYFTISIDRLTLLSENKKTLATFKARMGN